ncbi:tumor necrosis factor receptor superfamily member 1A [Genypterus blacodes]|uniref:tumor necrosis factor receptor superfamily member 1A n=1 Tax=Genypterus blacodes TaxID=154954 RepID=UPI003F76F45C
MEAVGYRGRWRVKVTAGSLLLLMCMLVPSWALALEPSEEQTCRHGEYLSEKGICCNKCSPGFKLVDECHGAGLRSNCTPCPAGEYTDQMNYYPNCRRCKSCKKKFEVVGRLCERDRDAECRCLNGFFKDVIDSGTSQCLKCTQCGAGERQTHACTPEHNTVCVCEQDYYRAKNKCVPCKGCTDCELHCPEVKSSTGVEKGNYSLVQVIAVAGVLALLALVLVGLITFIATRRHTRSELLQPSQLSQPSQPSDGLSPETTQALIFREEAADNSFNTAVPQSPVSDLELSNLPDCVPLEIKIPELIYAVLDLVPVLQVKQLVRSLGVTDTEIERAEMDHRACREAHYQMLRVWAERGSRASGGGRGGMLHRPLLEELLDKLRKMHLGQATEELETKYGIQ